MKGYIDKYIDLCNKLTLTDLVDKTLLQKIQDSFCDLNGYSGRIVDRFMNNITEPSNLTFICQKIYDKEEGLNECIYCSRKMLENHIKDGLNYQRCDLTGFTEGIFPIKINGHVFGYFLLSMISEHSLKDNNIQKIEKRYGISKSELIKYRDQNKYTEESFKKNGRLIEYFLNIIAELAFKNIMFLKEIGDNNINLLEMSEKDKMFLKLFKNTPDSIIITDQNNNIIDVNPAFTELSGYDNQELKSYSILDIFKKEDVIGFGNRISSLVKGNREDIFLYNNVIIGKNFKKIHIDMKVFAIRTEISKKLNIVYVISEYDKVSKISKKYDELSTKFESISDSSSEIYLIHEKGKIIETSDNFIKMFGYNNEDVQNGLNVIDLIAPAFQSSVSRKINSENMFDYEAMGRRKNGSFFYIRVSSRAIEYNNKKTRIAVIDDIDDIKKYESALLEEEEKFRRIFECSNLGMFIYEIDLEDSLRFLSLNKAASERFHLSIENIIGKKIEDIFKEVTIGFMNNVKNIARNGGGYKYESFPYKDDNVYGVFDISIFGIKKNLVVVEFNDVTERDTYRRNIESINEKLEKKVEERTKELQKLNEDLKAYSYTVSHDLKNPLNIISGYLDLLKMDHIENMNEQMKEFFGGIENNIERMFNLIEDILKFSQMSKKGIERENFDITDMIKQICENMKMQYNNNDVKVSIKERMSCYSDKKMVYVLLQNLIGNAFKYSSENNFIKINIDQDGDYYYIEDNGIGFDEKYKDIIFKPLKRLVSGKDFPGTGIGLATVKKIIDILDGEINCESSPGKGSKFSFRF